MNQPPRKIPKLYTAEYTIPFDSLGTTHNPIQMDQQTTILRIELLNITVQDVQVPDVGFPQCLTIEGGWVTEDFLDISLLTQSVPNAPNQSSQQPLFYHGIPIVFNQSPTTFIDFQKPKILLRDKPFNASNCLIKPKITAAADAVTQPFFTCATINLRFTMTKDQYNMKAAENLEWYLEKMSW